MKAADALLVSGRLRVLKAVPGAIRAGTFGPGHAQVSTWFQTGGLSWCSCGRFPRCKHAAALARVAPASLVKAAGLGDLL